MSHLRVWKGRKSPYCHCFSRLPSEDWSVNPTSKSQTFLTPKEIYQSRGVRSFCARKDGERVEKSPIPHSPFPIPACGQVLDKQVVHGVNLNLDRNDRRDCSSRSVLAFANVTELEIGGLTVRLKSHFDPSERQMLDFAGKPALEPTRTKLLTPHRFGRKREKLRHRG